MNKFQMFLDRILAETCLKMDDFGSKSLQIAKHWGFRSQTLLFSAEGDFASRPPFRLHDQRMCNTLFPLKLLVGNFVAKENLYFIFSVLLPHPFKNVSTRSHSLLLRYHPDYQCVEIFV